MSNHTAAVVTGAANGIGHATVERFLQSDHHDAVLGIDIDSDVETNFSETTDYLGIEVDIRDQKTVRDAIDEIEEPITAAVNNAGISRYSWIGDLEPEEWNELLAINLTGQYNLARVIGPRMYDRGKGAIVNVSSGAGQRGSASGGVHYSASKAGVIGLTKGLAKQLSPHVRVNCLVPGLMNTALTHDTDLWTEEELNSFTERVLLQRLGDPSEAAEVIAFLCGPGSSYITGSVVNVDGGSALI